MIRAEWTKFRTVRGWVAGVSAAVLVIVLLGVLTALGSNQSCMSGTVEVTCPRTPVGPGGEAVRDDFTFVHQPLTGDGEIIARVSDMTGTITYPPPGNDQIVAGLVPWAKAGIMVKAGTRPGSAYAAMLLTGHHGVRMQSDFTHDEPAPGFPGAAWLRLKRTGDQVTGYASADGTTWRRIDTVKLAGLPRTVQIGLFAASPSDITQEASSLGGKIVQARFTQAVADFSQVSPAGGWTYDRVGGDGGRTDWEKTHPPGFTESAGIITVTGSGDIAPLGQPGGGMTIETTLTGLFLALLLVMVVGVLFVTAEFRRGLIRTTLLATPDRGRVLAAKAVVIGGVTFAAGLVAVGVTVPLVSYLLGTRDIFLMAVPWWTALRVVTGAAALLSLAAVFAYAMGALFRRGLPAVAAAVVLLVLPRLLTTASVLPDGVVEWLSRVTPAAAFAVLQSTPAYPQVYFPYSPADGYYPLAPWAGLGVLLLYAAAALGVAVLRFRRADA